MTFSLGGIEFDNVEYDESGDVLYLHVGPPSDAEQFDETPEGHHVRFDRSGQLVGVTIVRPKYLLRTQGELPLTLTRRLSTVERVDISSLGSLLT